MINITPGAFGSEKSKKKYVASIYNALTELFSGSKIVINIDPDVDIGDLGDSLRGIAEIIDAAASIIVSKPDDKEDEDDIDDPYDSDSWKKGR